MSQNRKISLFVLIILIGVGLGMWLWPGPYEEGRCRLRRKAMGGDPSDNRLLGFTWQRLQPDTTDSGQTTGSWEDTNEPVSYRLATARGDIQIAMDVSDKPTLLVDTNGNGSLADERGLAPRTGKLRWWDRGYRFGPIRINSGDGDDQAATSFYAISQSQRPDQAKSLLLYPADYRHGKLRLGKNVYAVAVVDGDYDGGFDSRVSLPVDNPEVYLPRGNVGRWARADIFAIDYDRDGQFEMYPSLDLEVMPLGKLMRLGNTYYTITVARDGSHLALDVVKPAMGRLVFDPPHATVDLRLWSDAAYQSFRYANNLDLPAGNYQATSAVLILQDTERNEWMYKMVLGKLGPLGFFAIDPNQTTRIRMGPPFRVTAEIEEPQNNALTIRPIIEGTAGERYYWISKNTRSSGVTFRIVAEDGTVLVDDAFKYGGGGGFWYGWRVPSYFKGKYQVQINVDLGPFEVTHDRKWHVIE